MAVLITHAKCCDSRFRGLGVLVPLILRFSVGTAGRPCNSIITAVLQCDSMPKLSRFLGTPCIQSLLSFTTVVTCFNIVSRCCLLFTHADDSRGGRMFYLRLSVSFFRAISQQPMQLVSPNVTHKCFTIITGNPFILGQYVRGQGLESQE